MEELRTQNTQVMSVKDWAITVFVTSLPMIGFKKNYAKGSLLIMIIIFAVIFSFMFLFGGIAVISQIFNQ